MCSILHLKNYIRTKISIACRSRILCFHRYLLKHQKEFLLPLQNPISTTIPACFFREPDQMFCKGSFAAYPLEEKIAEGDYPEMVVSKRAEYLAKTKGTRNFPWRVMLIARQDKDLPANDLVYRLASPTTIKETDWIHPGKCTDEWIIDINLFNVPFKSGINTDSL